MKKLKPPKKLVIKGRGENIICEAFWDDDDGVWVAMMGALNIRGEIGFVSLYTPKQTYRVACWLMEFQEFLEKVGGR